jgi:hypothetical protein
MPARLSATIALIEPLFTLRHKPCASRRSMHSNVREERFLPHVIKKIEAIHATYSFCSGRPMK